MTTTDDIRPTKIETAIVYNPFDRALAKLQENGYKLISLEENAGLRILQKDKDHYVSKNGNWVKEGPLYVPKKGRFIIRHSLILDNPRKATQDHRDEDEYFVSDDQVRKALEDFVHVPYDVNEIPTDRFGEDEIAMFCFGKNAKDYGLFLKEAKISNMPLWFDEKDDYLWWHQGFQHQGKPYATQLFFTGLGDCSGLLGCNRGLNMNVGSRGIKMIADGVTARNK